jgi:hypothetical protein
MPSTSVSSGSTSACATAAEATVLVLSPGLAGPAGLWAATAFRAGFSAGDGPTAGVGAATGLGAGGAAGSVTSLARTVSAARGVCRAATRGGGSAPT